MHSDPTSWKSMLIADEQSRSQWERLVEVLRASDRRDGFGLPDDFHRYFRHVQEDRDVEGYAEEARILLDLFGSQADRVLDLACGYGVQALCLRLFGATQVTGLDYGALKVQAAGAVAEYCEVEALRFVQGSASALPFDAHSFSGVLLSSAISHLNRLEGALREIYRVLEPGGVVVIHDDTNALHLPTRRKMRRIWEMSEFGDAEQLADLGLERNFLDLRKDIIAEADPYLPPEAVNKLAHRSRGWTGDDLQRHLRAQQAGQHSRIRRRFQCVDPLTGVPQEELLNPLLVLALLRRIGFEGRLCPPAVWQYGGRTIPGKLRKKVRLLFWPVQIVNQQHYWIQATKV